MKASKIKTANVTVNPSKGDKSKQMRKRILKEPKDRSYEQDG